MSLTGLSHGLCHSTASLCARCTTCCLAPSPLSQPKSCTRHCGALVEKHVVFSAPQVETYSFSPSDTGILALRLAFRRCACTSSMYWHTCPSPMNKPCTSPKILAHIFWTVCFPTICGFSKNYCSVWTELLRLVPVLWRCSTTVALARHGLMLRRALGPLRRMATVLPFGPRLTPPQPKPGQALEPKWLRS